MKSTIALFAVLVFAAAPAFAIQGSVQEVPGGIYISRQPKPAPPPPVPQSSYPPAPASAPRIISLPINTLVEVTPAAEITSKEMKEGTKREFLVVKDVDYQGVVVIPRGSPVEAQVTWRTGKGIVGKSAKFELSFDWVRVGRSNYKLRGMHRQEGRGNTAGALLGAAFITGKSATMVPGQIVNVFTAETIDVTVQ